MDASQEYDGMSPESALFIDIPNVVYYDSEGPPVNPHWNVLFEHVLAAGVLDGTNLAYAGAYMPQRMRAWKVSRIAERVFKEAYPLIRTRHNARHGRDIDSWIISDLWHATVKHEQDSIQHGHLSYPIQMRYIIVSGDGGYLRALQSMSDAFKENLEYELVVYAWKQSLHPNLRDTASLVYFLDDIPGFLPSVPALDTCLAGSS